MRKIVYLSVLLFVFAGCGPIAEISRTMWGTSTRALNDARVDAAVLSYECRYDDCYKAVLDLTDNKLVDNKLREQIFNLFHQNYIKGYIVVMGVPWNVDTTEVGIFFSRVKENGTKIEISSLSVTAKENVYDIIDENLTAVFKRIE